MPRQHSVLTCVQCEKVAKAVQYPRHHVIVNDPSRRVANDVAEEGPGVPLYYLRNGDGNGLVLEGAYTLARKRVSM